MSPFGIIVSGRMVQTNFERIMPEQFLVTIPDADNINFIVVFLTGTEMFPTGCGGQVYFSWPDPKNPPTWQKLGFLTNEKPSAIFKISTLKKLDEICDDESIYPFGEQNINHNAQIGIAVEPLSNLTDGDVRQTKEGFRDFANRMVLNFVNYIASFTVNISQIAPNTNESFVPLSTVQNWCSTFDRRMARNPNFWKV